ncbi:MAG: Trm112 family protein [Candidatus Aminicenantes bacterium]|nr:Trm112 family protein [Candidatus Aminicenantes bacterium]
MAIDPELLEILACPVCKTSVTLTRDGKGLFCSRCRRLYPIVDDIPVMLVEEAVLVKKAGAAAGRPKKKAAGGKAKPATKKKTGLRTKAKSKAKTKPRFKTRPKAKAKSKARPKPKIRRKR